MHFKWSTISIALLFLLVATGCRLGPGHSDPQIIKGVASWYGNEFHGRPTASGERFNQRALTAAHRTLPFGTIVEVTNLRNGKKVKVRINDRGPFVKGRIIDLARGAAKKIDMVAAGISEVQLKILKMGNT